MSDQGDLAVTSVRFTKDELADMDQAVKDGKAVSRSELIRYAIKIHLRELRQDAARGVICPVQG
jgi:Arc/MetJ-type ribon-helix-helix transcriptional regulator